MEKHKLTLKKCIHKGGGHSIQDITLFLEIYLPFVPTPGLIIDVNPKDEILWDGLLLEELEYDLANGEFLCYVESDKSMSNMGFYEDNNIKTDEDVAKACFDIAVDNIKYGPWQAEKDSADFYSERFGLILPLQKYDVGK